MGFDDRQLVLAGAAHPGATSPEAAVIEAVERILRPYTRSIEVAGGSDGSAGIDFVLDGRAQLGAANLAELVIAHAGDDGEETRPGAHGLRVVANINHPQWLVVAVRRGLRIGDLGDVTERGLSVRVRAGDDPLSRLLLEHYGLDQEVIGKLGGSLASLSGDDAAVPADGIAEWVSGGDFDVIVATVHAGYSPASRHLHEASILTELDYLPVPDEVARVAARRSLGEWANLPAGLVRGVTREVASVSPSPHALYGLASMPDGFARLVAQSLDENRALLRQRHIALSYDTLNVGMGYGVPLHPGARRYYTSMHYPTGEAAEDHDHGEGEGHDHGHGQGHDHDHDHAHNHGPDLWEGIGTGRGAHAHRDHDHESHDHDHDHDTPATRRWEGGFGKR